MLQDIQIGRTSQILALDKEEGTVLSYADTKRFGDAYDTLSVRLADGDRTAGTEGISVRRMDQTVRLQRYKIQNKRTRAPLLNRATRVLCNPG